MEVSSVCTLSCPNCGAPIRHGDLGCDYCGASLYAERAAEITVPALAEAQRIIPEMQARIKQNPYDGDAYYQLGLACYTLRLYDQAENAFEQAQRYSPGSALAFYFTGLARLRQAEHEIFSVQEFRVHQMRKDFETALSLDPGLAEAGLYSTLTDALLARNREDYAGAIEPLQTVVSGLPKLGLAWKLLAACYFQIVEYEHAIQAGSQAWELDKMDEDSAYLIGAAFARLGNTEATEVWAQRLAGLRGSPNTWKRIVREFKGQIG